MSDNEEEDVLSQDDINDLLGSIGGDEIEDSGDEDGPRISIYDFRRPDFLSRDDVAQITEIGRAIEDRLSRLVPGMSLSSVDVLTTDEFTRSVGSPCFAVPLAFDPRRRILLELSPRVATHVVRNALDVGGSSSGDERQLSDLDVAVAAEAVAGHLSGAFPGFHLSPEAPVIEPDAIRNLGIGPMVCVVSYSVELSGYSGLVSLLIDRFTLETLILKPKHTGTFTGTATEGRPPDLVLREVLQFNLPAVTGGALIEALESGKIILSEPPTGIVTYRGE